MREILFRGKRRCNGEWVYGNLVVDKNYNPHIVPKDYFYEDGHHLQYCDDTDRPVFIDAETIGQFTGLTDKNGTKIFEGDIVQFGDNTKCEVKWGEYSHSKCDEYECEHYGWYVAHKRRNYVENTGYDLWDVASYITVIGNVHDNPELIGGADNG